MQLELPRHGFSLDLHGQKCYEQCILTLRGKPEHSLAILALNITVCTVQDDRLWDSRSINTEVPRKEGLPTSKQRSNGRKAGRFPRAYSTEWVWDVFPHSQKWQDWVVGRSEFGDLHPSKQPLRIPVFTSKIIGDGLHFTGIVWVLILSLMANRSSLSHKKPSVIGKGGQLVTGWEVPAV